MAPTRPRSKRKVAVEDEFSSDDYLNGDIHSVFSRSDAEKANSDKNEDGADPVADHKHEDDEEEAAFSDDEEWVSELERQELEIEQPFVDPKPRQNRMGEDNEPNYRIETDAKGGVRYVYDEIDPVYDSDDSDAQGPANTIGNIDPKYYESYPHIGYDINGKKILRPATGGALSALLDSIELPEGWTGLTDDAGKPIKLSKDELHLIRHVQTGVVPEKDFDQYPDMVEYFTNTVETMPLSAAPEPKRRFLPSKNEAKTIAKLVRAMREGRIGYKSPEEREKEEEEQEHRIYDIWADEVPREPNVMHIKAPKLPPPGYDMSYRPPLEYLPNEEERQEWEETEPEERKKEYLPRSFDALRKVPGYDNFLKERFHRCLDLYLAPRVRKNRMNIDPMSLLPKLPKPDELRPFPTVCQTIFRGHEGRVRSIDVDPSGSYMASGGDDGTVRVWDLLTGRELQSIRISTDEPVSCVRWRPTKDAFVVAAAVEEDIYLMIPLPLMISPELEQASRAVLDAGFGHEAPQKKPQNMKKQSQAQWVRAGAKSEDDGVFVRVTVRSPVKSISWHRRGDYFCSVSPTGQRSSVQVHTLSKHLTQIPFRRLSGLAQTAHFHPSRPLFLVATQRRIRVYDLQKLELVKILEPGAGWISGFDIHPGGDNLIASSYDKRLLWHDLELSNQPYRTLRFHGEAIRAAKFHKGGLPLFADASDDGTVQVFYGKVAGQNDALAMATIVPVKKLTGHKVVQRLGVMDVSWHPIHPWIVSAGADGTCRLYT